MKRSVDFYFTEWLGNNTNKKRGYVIHRSDEPSCSIVFQEEEDMDRMGFVTKNIFTLDKANMERLRNSLDELLNPNKGWCPSSQMPTKEGYYLCKGQGVYTVLYYNGTSDVFLTNECGWITHWRYLEENY